MSYDADVEGFHRKFGLPATGDAPPALLGEGEFQFRRKFMQEELDEFCDAHARGDMAEALDALVDLAWVAIGTAHYMRCPFDAAWREVVRANMEKVRAETDPNKPYRDGVGGAVVKPPGWNPPDIGQVLRLHGFRMGMADAQPDLRNVVVGDPDVDRLDDPRDMADSEGGEP